VEKTIQIEDVKPALDGMIQQRNHSTCESSFLQNKKHLQRTQTQSMTMNAPPPIEQAMEITAQDVMEEVEEDQREETQQDERDNGVTDEIWAELQIAKQKYAETLEAIKQEEEEEKKRFLMEQEEKRRIAMQEKLRQISPCPAGFSWFKVDQGWRCSGGAHFVSDAQLLSQFSF
jgi:hypothetical protein